MRNSKLATVLATLAIGGLALTGCSANQGGDTTCGDYLEMDTEGQREVIEEFLTEDGRSEVPNGEIILNSQTISVYCQTLATDDDPIRNAGDLLDQHQPEG